MHPVQVRSVRVSSVARENTRRAFKSQLLAENPYGRTLRKDGAAPEAAPSEPKSRQSGYFIVTLTPDPAPTLSCRPFEVEASFMITPFSFFR